MGEGLGVEVGDSAVEQHVLLKVQTGIGVGSEKRESGLPAAAAVLLEVPPALMIR
jgi:hypothetical protein